MSIRTHDYEVIQQAESVVRFTGSLRLNAAPDYQPIADLLEATLAKADGQVTLDLCELKFLNSSGINLLYQFVLKFKKSPQLKLRVLGSNQNAWQPRSLGNMVKFLPTVTIAMQD